MKNNINFSNFNQKLWNSGIITKISQMRIDTLSRINQRYLERRNISIFHTSGSFHIDNSLSNLINKSNLLNFGENLINIQQYIRQWELNIRYFASNLNPAASVGGFITTNVIKSVYGSMGASLWALSVYDTANILMSGAITFMSTIYTLGSAAQIINPPVYHTKITPWGREGFSSYSIPVGHVKWQETLYTSASHWWKERNIVRIHTDFIKSKYGTFKHQVITTTPASSPFERFIAHHLPLGNYFDPGRTIIHEIRTHYFVIHETWTRYSYTHVPISNYRLPSWNNLWSQY